MQTSRRARAILAGLSLGATALGVTAAPRVAVAAPETVATPERLKAAAEEFDKGRRAYLAKDFEQAAIHFENAYRDAPRAETLRLAIRARREAKQLARAATHAALAVDRYGDDPTTAQLAREVLAEAGPLLHDVTVECAADCSLAADGRVVSQTDAPRHRLFLDPGPHELGIGFRQGSVSRKLEARRGGKDVLTVEAPPEPAAPPPVTAPPPPPASLVVPSRDERGGTRKPFGPAVFFVAAGVTLVAGGATVASGIDARNNPGVEAVRRECAGKDASCPLYQEGQAAETRTNILLGVTAGAFTATAIIGLFFTRWSAPPAAPTVTAGPGGVAASWTTRF